MNHRTVTNFFRILSLVICALPVQLMAEEWVYDPWALCPPYVVPELEAIDEPPASENDLQLSADMGQLVIGNKTLMRGNVIAIYQGKTLMADEAIYDQINNTVELNGNILFDSDQVQVRGPGAKLNLNQESGSFPRASYRLKKQHGRGIAEQIEIIDQMHIELDEAYYTTCPPEKEDWRLSGQQVYLDREEGQGTARNATLRFKKVPLFYSPWVTFPIDDRRKSGLLYPEIGTSSNRGAEFALPYYWNIAPNYDYTLTPRLMGKRGLQLGNEFRYLHQKNSGEIGLDYLHEDKSTGDTRWFYSISHRGNPLQGLRTRLFINSASDSNYFQDFSTDLAVNSTTHLERLGELTYTTRHWNALARVQNFQTIDPTILPENRPYQRLPQFRLDGRYADGPAGLDIGLNSEWVHFYRDEGVTGKRLDLDPYVSFPVRRLGYFFDPKLSYRLTRYDLEETGGLNPSQIDRALPTLSLDGGLFFDRSASNSVRQTLEPRVFYLYTPEDNQDDIPLFDTGEPTFSFGQLFRRNRFTGADRVGDANQLSLAVTSRLLKKQSGNELLRGSIGQIIYFQDRMVTLDGSEPRTKNRSDLAAELASNPLPEWRGQVSMLWDPFESQIRRGSADLRYHRNPKHVLNFGYRYNRDDYNQTDVSFAWRLNPQWQGLGRWAYSLQDNEDVATMLGLEYENCCWKTRIVARRFVTATPGDYNSGVFIQLVLKGLGGVGNEPNALLEQTIPGYKTYD